MKLFSSILGKSLTFGCTKITVDIPYKKHAKPINGFYNFNLLLFSCINFCKRLRTWYAGTALCALPGLGARLELLTSLLSIKTTHCHGIKLQQNAARIKENNQTRRVSPNNKSKHNRFLLLKFPSTKSMEAAIIEGGNSQMIQRTTRGSNSWFSFFFF